MTSARFLSRAGFRGRLEAILEESPEGRRLLVLLLYALVAPSFSGAMYLLVGRDGLPSVLLVLGICLAALPALTLRRHPGRWDWVYPSGIAPVLCCGIAFHALGLDGLAFLSVLTAPLAWSAVLFELPAVVTAYVSSSAVCFFLSFERGGWGPALSNTFIFAVIEGLVAWVVYGKSSNHRLARLESLERHDHVPELTMDESGRILSANRNALQTYGYGRDEILRMNVLDLRDPSSRGEILSQMRETIVKGRKVFETRHLRKDGSVFPVEVHSRRYSVGGRSFLHSLVHDITERKAIEEMLRESEAFNRGVIENHPDVILIHHDGSLLFVNPKASVKLGYRNEEMVGRELLEFATPAAAAEVRKVAERRSRGEVAGEYEVEIVAKGGAVLTFLASGNPIRYHGFEAQLVVLSDITDRKREENDRRLLYERNRREIERAQAVQESLNPAVLPRLRDVVISAAFLPAEGLSGDLFLVRSSSDASALSVVLADCTGHGLATSMDATLLKMLLDRHLESLFSEGPSEFLARVNRDCFHYLSSDQFPTLLAARLDLADRRLSVANAGSPPPLLLRKDGMRFLDETRGIPLNFQKERRWETSSLPLSSGEGLLFHSDALVEIRQDGEILGTDRVFAQAPGEELHREARPMDRLLERARSLGGGFPLGDDLTLVHLRLSDPERLREEWPAALAVAEGSARLRGMLRRWGWREGAIEPVLKEVGGLLGEASRKVFSIHVELQVDGYGLDLAVRSGDRSLPPLHFDSPASFTLRLQDVRGKEISRG